MDKAIQKLNQINWDKTKLQTNAKRFSKERFKKEVIEFVKRYAGAS